MKSKIFGYCTKEKYSLKMGDDFKQGNHHETIIPDRIESVVSVAVDVENVEDTIVETENGHLTEHEYYQIVDESDRDEHGTDNIEDTRYTWSREHVLLLLKYYKEHLPRFNTTEKKYRIWQDIAKLMPPYTADKCENKFKYLKRRFAKRKNGSNTKFEFYDEMAELLDDSDFRSNSKPTPQKGLPLLEVVETDDGPATLVPRSTFNNSTEARDFLLLRDALTTSKRKRLDDGEDDRKKKIREARLAIQKRKVECLERLTNAIEIIAQKM